VVVVGFNDGTATPDGKVWDVFRAQRSKVQLIGCIDNVSDGDPVLGRTCHYNTPTVRDVPTVETTTQLSLYEARTGRKVADVQVPSGSDDVCPTRMTIVGDDPTVEATPGYPEYQEALRDYVDK
jgi:hypothetical protein